MDQRLSIITLGVSSLANSKAFYSALGWQVSNEGDEGIIAFNIHQMALALYPVDKLAEDAEVDLQVDGYPKMTLAYNVDSDQTVDAILVDAEQAGARIIKPAQKVFWGGYSGYFADPDNFLWEVAYNPYAILGPNGEFQWSKT